MGNLVLIFLYVFVPLFVWLRCWLKLGNNKAAVYDGECAVDRNPYSRIALETLGKTTFYNIDKTCIEQKMFVVVLYSLV